MAPALHASSIAIGVADSLESLMAQAPVRIRAHDTASDEVCLIGFTSGTTGVPKGTMHFHRDVMAICDTFGKHVLRPRPETASSARRRSPSHSGWAAWRCSRCAPAPPTILLERRRRMSCCPRSANSAPRSASPRRPRTARCSASSPRPTFPACAHASPLANISGARPLTLGSRDRYPHHRRHRVHRNAAHFHRARAQKRCAPGATGKPVPGYEAKVIDEAGRELPHGTVGRLAVRGPDRLPLSRR